MRCADNRASFTVGLGLDPFTGEILGAAYGPVEYGATCATRFDAELYPRELDDNGQISCSMIGVVPGDAEEGSAEDLAPEEQARWGIAASAGSTTAEEACCRCGGGGWVKDTTQAAPGAGTQTRHSVAETIIRLMMMRACQFRRYPADDAGAACA